MASFGEYLRREREARGVSLREIADTTKIGVRFLKALEDDRFDVLPGGLFPRAFVRQYAKHVGLNVEQTLEEFARQHASRVVERPTVQPPPETAWFLRQPWSGRIGVGASLVLVAAILALTGRHAPRPRRAPAPLPVVETSPARVYPPPTPTPEAVDGLTLTLTAEQNCWVEIHVDGEVVLNRVLAVGETATLEASQEIRLSVGNAGGLALSVNERPGLPLGRAGEVRRDILINHESLSSFIQDDPSSVSG